MLSESRLSEEGGNSNESSAETKPSSYRVLYVTYHQLFEVRVPIAYEFLRNLRGIDLAIVPARVQPLQMIYKVARGVRFATSEMACLPSWQ